MNNTEFSKNQKITESAKDLMNILNLISYPIFVKDENSLFVIANQALCTMLGLELKDIIGKTLGESLPPDQMEHFLTVDRAVLKSGKEDVTEEPLTAKGGKILTIITKKSLYVDDQGNKFLIGIINDITKQKEAEESLKDKIQETERMNKLMIDREMTMINLKSEIANLQKKQNEV